MSRNTLAVATIGSSPATRNAGPYEKRSTRNPTANVKAAPARPAANPLRPVTVATTSCGKRSEGSVNPMVDQLAYPHRATQISARAEYALWTRAAGIPARIGIQLTAHTHIR